MRSSLRERALRGLSHPAIDAGRSKSAKIGGEEVCDLGDPVFTRSEDREAVRCERLCLLVPDRSTIEQ
jgi:hypothetical protein